MTANAGFAGLAAPQKHVLGIRAALSSLGPVTAIGVGVFAFYMLVSRGVTLEVGHFFIQSDAFAGGCNL